MLSHHHWLEVVERTPLISIDLIIHDPQGRVLLGYRLNDPARNTWFVPGGVIRKDERLDDAFARIVLNELGLRLTRADAKFRNVYEHFYANNFARQPGVSTHYLVLAHDIHLDPLPALPPPKEQHSELRLFTIQELLTSPKVHPLTRAYFE